MTAEGFELEDEHHNMVFFMSRLTVTFPTSATRTAVSTQQHIFRKILRNTSSTQRSGKRALGGRPQQS